MDKNQGIFVKENSIFLEANPKLDYTFLWVSWATKTKPITLSHPLPHQGLGEKTDFIFFIYQSYMFSNVKLKFKKGLFSSFFRSGDS